MYLLEHDAKEILSAHGIPAPAGVLIENADAINPSALPPGPWIVKGQIAAGGRGKAGIIRKAQSLAEAVRIYGEQKEIALAGEIFGQGAGDLMARRKMDETVAGVVGGALEAPTFPRLLEHGARADFVDRITHGSGRQ